MCAFNMCCVEFKNKSSWRRLRFNAHISDVLGQGEAWWLRYVKGNTSSVKVKSQQSQDSLQIYIALSDTCMNIRFQYARLNATAMFYVLSAQ
jgi:hypothetical protein